MKKWVRPHSMKNGLFYTLFISLPACHGSNLCPIEFLIHSIWLETFGYFLFGNRFVAYTLLLLFAVQLSALAIILIKGKSYWSLSTGMSPNLCSPCLWFSQIGFSKSNSRKEWNIFKGCSCCYCTAPNYHFLSSAQLCCTVA